jgi:serine/threonine-protein kinase
MSAGGSAQLPTAGEIVAGKYVLDRLLGQGGMGAVFAAKHLQLGRNVAIKVMLADASHPGDAQRFVNEARAAANIQNEHVVHVFDIGEEGGYAYMVLELLEGEDLSQVLAREPPHRLPPHIAVGYVTQALAGVTQAHALGIVHRDLKPANLFLAKRKDGSTIVKVLDFGISKTQSSSLSASPSSLTSTDTILGSPLYMSPEQLRSPKGVDLRADIWAMGVILYELITGLPPFGGESIGELFAAILENDPPPLGTRVGGVHPALDQIVLRCLRRRPDDRFQTAAELAQALSPFASPQTSLGPGGPLSSTAMLGPDAGWSGTAYPSLPPSARSAGSDPHVIAGAAGAVTPRGMQQTGGGWQSTDPGSAKTSALVAKAPLVAAAIVAVALLAGGAGTAVHFTRSKHEGPSPAARPETALPPSAESAPPIVAPPPEEKAATGASAEPSLGSPAASAPESPPTPKKPVHDRTVAPPSGPKTVPRPSESRPRVKPGDDPPKESSSEATPMQRGR